MPTDFLPDDVYLIPERLSVNLTCPLWGGGTNAEGGGSYFLTRRYKDEDASWNMVLSQESVKRGRRMRVRRSTMKDHRIIPVFLFVRGRFGEARGGVIPGSNTKSFEQEQRTFGGLTKMVTT